MPKFDSNPHPPEYKCLEKPSSHSLLMCFHNLLKSQDKWLLAMPWMLSQWTRTSPQDSRKHGLTALRCLLSALACLVASLTTQPTSTPSSCTCWHLELVEILPHPLCARPARLSWPQCTQGIVPYKVCSVCLCSRNM